MYETTSSEVTTKLSAGDPQVFTAETIALINTLGATGSSGSSGTTIQVDEPTLVSGQPVTVASGTNMAVLKVAASATKTDVTFATNVPVVIFEGAGGVNVEFNDTAAPPQGTSAGRVVVGSDGGNVITVKDNVNSAITAGAGNDSIVSGGGQDTISAGRGSDSIDAGAGFDMVKIAAPATDIEATVVNGELVLTNKASGVVVQAKNAQYVQLDGGKAVIAVGNAVEAAITMLYETYRPLATVKVESTADAAGLQYWIDRYKAGDSLFDISQEFAAIFGVATTGNNAATSMSNEDFLASIYLNTFGRTNVAQSDAAGWNYWMGRMADGASRAVVAAQFAEIAVQNFDNPAVTTVGYVKIIDGLI